MLPLYMNSSVSGLFDIPSLHETLSAVLSLYIVTMML